jgi:hypothetical protein
MSRAGEDMVRELAKLLGDDLTKTAAKKEKEEKDEKKEDKKEEKKEKCEKCDKEECECKKEKKEDKKDEKKEDKKEKKDKKKKKAEVLVGVVNDLVKMANELDAAGASEAASLVDDALQVIMKGLEGSADAEKKS